MKNIVKILMTTLITLMLTSCYDRDVLDSKEFNFALPTVQNLDCVKQGTTAHLVWQIPTDISDDFKRPIEVSIQVIENDIYRQIVTVTGEKTTADIAVVANKKYRFVVKLLGYLKDEVREKGLSDKVYSGAQIVEIN